MRLQADNQIGAFKYYKPNYYERQTPFSLETQSQKPVEFSQNSPFANPCIQKLLQKYFDWK